MQEDKIDQQISKINELLQLSSQQDVAHHLIDLLNMLKERPQVDRSIKNVYKINHVDKLDFDPQVNLEIEGVLIPQVVVEFGSQVNILPRDTSVNLGTPKLEKLDFYLKLADQGLVDPLGIQKDIKTTIMDISTRIDFQVIEPKQGSNSYATLVGRPWGRNMKGNISLDKDILKIKGKGKKISIPLDPRDGQPCEEPNEDNVDIYQLYQAIQKKKDSIEPNKNEEYYLGSPMFVGQNSNSELYNQQIENYEMLSQECWSIKEIPRSKVCSFFLVSLVPKIFEKKV